MIGATLSILVFLIILLIFFRYSAEKYRIGGGNGLFPTNEVGIGGWLTGGAGISSICDCQRSQYTGKTKLYHDDTVPADNGDDCGRHYRRVAYVGWDKPVLTCDFCR